MPEIKRPKQKLQINNMHISCDELYQSCNNISWNDPLNCGYCVNPDGSGVVMPEGKLICPTFMRNICPPSIDYLRVGLVC